MSGLSRQNRDGWQLCYYANLDTAFQKSNTNYVQSKHLISIWGLKAHLDLALKHWWVQYMYIWLAVMIAIDNASTFMMSKSITVYGSHQMLRIYDHTEFGAFCMPQIVLCYTILETSLPRAHTQQGVKQSSCPLPVFGLKSPDLAH